MDKTFDIVHLGILSAFGDLKFVIRNLRFSLNHIYGRMFQL